MRISPPGRSSSGPHMTLMAVMSMLFSDRRSCEQRGSRQGRGSTWTTKGTARARHVQATRTHAAKVAYSHEEQPWVRSCSIRLGAFGMRPHVVRNAIHEQVHLRSCRRARAARVRRLCAQHAGEGCATHGPYLTPA